jgi:hypothetical protein
MTPTVEAQSAGSAATAAGQAKPDPSRRLLMLVKIGRSENRDEEQSDGRRH